MFLVVSLILDGKFISFPDIASVSDRAPVCWVSHGDRASYLCCSIDSENQSHQANRAESKPHVADSGSRIAQTANETASTSAKRPLLDFVHTNHDIRAFSQQEQKTKVGLLQNNSLVLTQIQLLRNRVLSRKNSLVQKSQKSHQSAIYWIIL
jgi:hypothetical protein